MPPYYTIEATHNTCPPSTINDPALAPLTQRRQERQRQKTRENWRWTVQGALINARHVTWSVTALTAYRRR